jgi:citrate lyase beta subunit
VTSRVLVTSHVVYGGAHLFTAKTPEKLGSLARAAFEKYVRPAGDLKAAFGAIETDDELVLARVADKLQKLPVEDIRIDFEDGYGVRTEEEEMKDAARTAKELGAILAARGSGAGPAFGIRIRAIRKEAVLRVLRTLNVFCTNLVESGAKLPADFVVTLPKVRSATEVSTLAVTLGALEQRFGAPRIGIELMAETKEAASRRELESWIAAGEGRVRSLHLGAYDFLSELGVLARSQRLHHPFTDSLRTAMKLATADTDVATFDGATTVLPIESHKAKDGAKLSSAEEDENKGRVHGAFTQHFSDVTASLDKGFFASWILYPAQLVSHAVAISSFYADEAPRALVRLTNFTHESARATAVGTSFDDRATARGLVSFFARGLRAGVLSAADLGSLAPHEALIVANDVDGLVAATSRG